MQKQQFGMIGLGVMGQNFALNVERNGFGVSVFDINKETVNAYIAGKASGKNVKATYSLRELVESLERPRRIMLLVPAGRPVDSVISQITHFLQPGDLLIDGGNSFFQKTERRAKELANIGLSFLGMGVSGGEEGALYGPSLMPGGPEKAYRQVESILQAVAAKAPEDGEPCVTYIGPGGAGHYVKMVHNGIEYGDMQLIAEAYHLLKRALNLSAEELHDIFAKWNRVELASFLIEITAKIFLKMDSETGQPLVELILDKAGQKGTGRWTSQNALELGAPIPTITAAVDARILSALKAQRVEAAKVLPGPEEEYEGGRQVLIDAVRGALYASKICSYAQGMSLLQEASAEYNYNLNLSAIAKIWRAGCIIRAKLLNEIARAYGEQPQLQNLLLDETLGDAVTARLDQWRFAVITAIELGVPMPATSASLAYYDSYRSSRLPANLIQAQRDFFGAHTFERVDREGVFHADWSA